MRFASDGVVMDVDFAEINYDVGMDEGEEPAQGHPAADVGQLDSVFDTVDTGRGETDSTMMSSATPGTDGPSSLQQKEGKYEYVLSKRDVGKKIRVDCGKVC